MTSLDCVVEDTDQNFRLTELRSVCLQDCTRLFGRLRLPTTFHIGHGREDGALGDATPKAAIETKRFLHYIVSDIVWYCEVMTDALHRECYAVVARDQRHVPAFTIDAPHC